MTNSSSNAAAFPAGPAGEVETGLTKREWFAGMAMQGMLPRHMEVTTSGEMSLSEVNCADANLIDDAFAFADMMLAATDADGRGR